MARLAVVIAVVALIAAACGGGAKGTGPTPTSLSRGHTEPANFNNVVATGAGKSAAAGFSETYSLRATIDGKVIDRALTWSQKGERLRGDFSGQNAGQTVAVSVISGPNYPNQDLMYVCKRDDRTCAEAHRTKGGDYAAELVPSLIGLRLLDIRIFSAGLNFYDESARTIAGQAALCFVGRSDTAGAIDHGTVCLTEAGLPLLVTAAGTGRTISLTATKPPGSVGHDAFDLPYALAGR